MILGLGTPGTSDTPSARILPVGASTITAPLRSGKVKFRISCRVPTASSLRWTSAKPTVLRCFIPALTHYHEFHRENRLMPRRMATSRDNSGLWRHLSRSEEHTSEL